MLGDPACRGAAHPAAIASGSMAPVRNYGAWRLCKNIEHWEHKYACAKASLLQFHCRRRFIFDVGANSGNRIQAFLECGANVVAIEPQPDCVAHLRAIYCNNKSLIVIEAAAGRAARTQRLRRAKPLDPAACCPRSLYRKHPGRRALAKIANGLKAWR